MLLNEEGKLLWALTGIVAGLKLAHCANVWSTQNVAKISLDVLAKRFIPCVALLFPGERASGEMIMIGKAMQQQELTMTRIMPISGYSGDELTWRDCNHLLYVLPAWLPRASSQFQRVANTTKEVESTWLILLPEGTSAEEFIGFAAVPFLTRVMTVVASDTYQIREMWRVAAGYPLRTAVWATWSPTDGLVCSTQQCLYPQRKDLEGHPVKAATKEDMPISQLIGLPNGTLAIDGYFGEVYYELLNRLNATPVVVQARENMTGSADVDGQWNGLVGMMQRNEIDLAVGPLSVNRQTTDVANLLNPLIRTNYQVFFKQSGTVFEWGTIFKPFAIYVWILILLWNIVGAITLNYFYRIGVANGQEESIYAAEYTKRNAFFTFLRALSAQGTNVVPKSMSCRFLYLTAYLSFNVLLTAYSAALISNLTTQEPIRPFDSLETFLKDGTYRITAIGRSTDYTYFSEATDPIVQEIFKRQVLRENLPTGKEEGILQVCEGNRVALFITFTVTQISAREISTSRNCPILFFKTPLGVVFMALGARKGMPFTSLLNHEIQSMAEKGLLKRLQGKEWPLPPTATTLKTSQAMEIGQVATVYVLLLTGVGLSIVILAAEKIHSFFNRRFKYFRKFTMSTEYFGTIIIHGVACALLVVVIVGYWNKTHPY